MRPTRWIVPVALLCAGFACNAPVPEVAAPVQRSFGKPVALCELDEPQIDESSGVAASRRADGVWYTHNDSGDRARFFRFDERGHVDAEFSLEGAVALDWEDMASATVGGKGFLYLADIGDNLRIRASVTVYRVEEPTGKGRALGTFERFVLTYPDGPHDAEAFFVRPETGDLYLVAKSASQPSGVYKLSSPSPIGTHMLERIGELELGGALEPSRLVTGGDVSPDGRHVLLRTYLGAYEFPAGQGASFDKWVRATPRAIEIRAEVQGEAIAYARDGRGIVTTSERAPCPVSLVRIRN